MKSYQVLSEERIMIEAKRIDLESKLITAAISKRYGRENTQKILKEAVRIQEKEVGVERRNRDFLIRMGRIGFNNKVYDQHLLENINQISGELLKNKKFTFSSLQKRLREKGVISLNKSALTGKKGLQSRHLYGIIKHQSPELYNNIFDFFVYKRPKSPQSTFFGNEIIEARVLDAMWHGVKRYKEIIKYCRMGPNDVTKILNTSKNPIIKMWVREYETKRKGRGPKIGQMFGAKYKRRK